jgi:hypothetical protein
MKKVFLLLTIALFAVSLPSLAESKGSLPGEISGVIKSVVVNADVTLVLVNDNERLVRMDGSESFMKNIRLRQNGTELIVDAVKKVNLKEKGVIYIYAGELTNIQVNSAAYVCSSGILELARLDIMINGNCKILIRNIGDLQLHASDYYEFQEETRRMLIRRESLSKL